MTTICRENIKSAIDSTEGKLFSVSFIKADGSLRKMTCRTGVPGKNGGESTTAHKPHLRTVYDINIKDHRNINLDTMLTMKCWGQKFALR